jgi:hypothetical protein
LNRSFEQSYDSSSSQNNQQQYNNSDHSRQQNRNDNRSRASGGGGGGFQIGRESDRDAEQAAKKRYQQELQSQMREAQMRKVQSKQEKDEYERKLEAEIKRYNYFGRSGGGSSITNAPFYNGEQQQYPSNTVREYFILHEGAKTYFRGRRSNRSPGGRFGIVLFVFLL